jgi:cation diffusion facilitator family transporter
MSAAHAFEFPVEQQKQRRRAGRLSWLSVALLISTAILVWATLGQSEAMKTAWVEDLLGLVPPIVLVAALRLENRTPNRRFPFGYFRVVSIAFLVTSAVLSIAGLWLLYDSVTKLLKKERPPIGAMTIAGHTLWAGWPMIAALCYCVVIGILLGRLKGPVAEELNDKALAADADMNKAGWTSEGAAIVGILLIGYGQWWGDSAAAAFISLNIVRDGWVNLRQVVADLLDESPTKIGGVDLDDLPEKIRHVAESLPWVKEASVRLREHGHVMSGDVFVVPRGETVQVEQIERASADLAALDWRIYSLTVMPVRSLENARAPRTRSVGS